MILNKLILRNYRNYDDEVITFDKNVNFIIGQNAQGKTNLIEAIYYAGYGKSFRYAKDQHLIKEDQENLYFGLEYSSRFGSNLIEVKMNRQKNKEIRINRQPIERMSELIGQLSVIVFTPEDLKIVREGPAYRRRFIDRQISLVDKVYYGLLVDYNRILNQRNNYLRKMAGKKIDALLIETFDEKLIEFGSKIILKRLRFIEKMQLLAKKIHLSLTEQKEMFEIGYLSPILSHLSGEYGKIEAEYRKMMDMHLERDLRYLTTHFGPHRDDLRIEIDDRELKVYGSQGQVRTAALTLVLSVLELTKEEMEENPILLLDDVFSELDHKRKNMLVGFISDIQTLITATDLEGIDVKRFGLSSIYDVSSGKIRRA